MKTIYDKDCKYTEDANDASDLATKALEPIMKKFIDMGYSPREISHVFMGVAFELECKECL